MKKKSKSVKNKKLFFFELYPFSEFSIKDDWIEIANRTINESKTKLEFKNYYCFYFGGDDLKIYPVARNDAGDEAVIPYDDYKADLSISEYDIKDMPYKAGKGLKNSWDIFYKNAYLDGILFNLSGKYFLRDIEGWEASDALEDLKDEHGVTAKGRGKWIEKDIVGTDKKLLQLIREKPMVLHAGLILDRLIDILTIARFEVDKEKKKEALLLLKKHLIPSDKNWKNRLVLEINYNLAIELMKRLAEYLSKKCKTALKKQGYYPEDLGRIKDAYTDIIEWATNEREWRISGLPEHRLELLINYPATKFLDDLFKDKLPSYKTLKDRLDK